jgi:pimeloyl-ACP methyl ester carboxylesterase
MVPMTFSIGYHSLHPNVSMNFQMNRWYGWVGEPEMLEEMRMVAPRIATYADWTREFVALAERATLQGHVLRAGFYWRSAEFFMRADDPERKSAREKFLGAVRSVYGLELGERHAVPYADGRTRGFLPAYRFRPLRSKCAIVFFGGFDSYIEELTSAFIYLRDAGYDVVAFDGPGQGGALNESGLPMTAEWHKPVGAVFDYFKVEWAALVGLSLGGCLVLRAAASEPRVERLVAYDVFTNLLDANLRQTTAALRGLLRVLLRLRAANLVNGIFARVARRSPVVEWGIEQGMHITGTTSAIEFLQKSKQFQTADVSASIRQDVLLLAGSEDHYVPTEQWHHQIGMLKNARSITARLFTRNESAQNHCQVGNYGLALRTIVKWLDEMLVEKAEKVEKLQATGKKGPDVAQIYSNPIDIDIKSAPLQSGPAANAAAASGVTV